MLGWRCKRGVGNRLGNDREAYLPGAGNRAGKPPKCREPGREPGRDPGREVKLRKFQINVCRTLENIVNLAVNLSYHY